MIKLACEFSPGEKVIINQETDGVIDGIWCSHPGRIEYNVKYLNGMGEYTTSYFKENELTTNDKKQDGWEEAIPYHSGPFIAEACCNVDANIPQGAD